MPTPTLEQLRDELYRDVYFDDRMRGHSEDLRLRLAEERTETGTRTVEMKSLWRVVDKMVTPDSTPLDFYPLWQAVKDMAADLDAPRMLRGVCRQAVDLRGMPNRADTDVTDATWTSFLAKLVDAGLMLPAQRAAVVALAVAPVTRAEKLWGSDAPGAITTLMIDEALALGAPPAGG